MQKEHPYNLFINMTILYIHTDMALNSRLCTGMANTHTKTQDGEVNSNTQGIGDWGLTTVTILFTETVMTASWHVLAARTRAS